MMKYNKNDENGQNEQNEANENVNENESKNKNKNENNQDNEPVEMEKGDLLAIIIACLVTILPILLFLTGLIVLAIWFL